MQHYGQKVVYTYTCYSNSEQGGQREMPRDREQSQSQQTPNPVEWPSIDPAICAAICPREEVQGVIDMGG